MGTEFEQKWIFRYVGIFQSISIISYRKNVCIYLIFPIPCLYLLVSTQLLSFPWKLRGDVTSFPCRGQNEGETGTCQVCVTSGEGAPSWKAMRILFLGICATPTCKTSTPHLPRPHWNCSFSPCRFVNQPFLALHYKYLKSIILSWHRNKNRAWLGTGWKRFLKSICRVNLPKECRWSEGWDFQGT